MLKNEKPKTEFDFEKKLKTSTKVYFKSCVASDAAAPEKSPNVSMTNDSKYIYLHSEVEGLMKIGTGFNYTMLGKVYIHKPQFRLKERSSLAFIHGHLYYRSSRIAPLVLIELDPETLEEMSSNILFDNQVPNCLFAEMTSPDIEFPHPPVDPEVKTKNKETAIQTSGQKTVGEPGNTGTSTSANPQKRDIRLMRPGQRSPIFTEGRYLYVVSQWTVEARTRTNEEEDEEEEGGDSSVQNDLRQAKYGVDIYDPLNEFEHVRSVELVDTINTVKDANTGKTKQKPAMNIKCLDQASFATNGSELVMAVPPNVEEGNEIRYKYFSLKDGKLLRLNVIKEPFYYTTLCYDIHNNMVFGVNDTKKTFDTMACYTNTTIPEKFSYNEDSEFYFPYENEKIVEIALEALGFSEEEGDRNKEKMEKLKDDWQILLNLGFTNKDYPGMNLGDMATLYQNKEQKDLVSRAMQLFILANIARLADSYANLSHNKSKDLDSIDNFRRPYCVNLLPKVFEYLQQFLEHYSKAFFIEDKAFTPEIIYDQCSFLCTLRIIKYNLANAEGLSNHLKKMNVTLPKKDFLQLFQKLLYKCVDNSKEVATNRDFEEIRRSVYQECLNILRYNLSFIYEDSMEAILRDLRKYLENLDRKQEKDLILPIFGWLKENNHIVALVGEVLNEQNTNRNELVKEISGLIDFIISCEVKSFCRYINSIDNYEKLPLYNCDNFIAEAMGFLLEFQKELLYQVGQKVQDKNLELSPIFILTSNVTECITRHAVSINEAFEVKVRELAKRIENDVKDKGKSKEESKEEEIKEGGTASPVIKNKGKDEKKKSESEIIADLNNQAWENLTQIFNYKVFFSQVLTVQVNTLTLLASNFLIAAKTLKHISSYLNSLNSLYAARKELTSANLEKVSTFFKEKVEVLESEHPPAVKLDKKEKVHIPGAKSLRISFDPQCDLKKNCQYLQFFSDDKYKDKITERMDRTGDNTNFPKEDLIIEGDTVYFMFHTDNCRLSQWGYKFTVHASIQDIQESDWMAGFHRTTCWLASKCAAQLINGSALAQALLQDEEQRYNSLLNSKLFSGGMEKCYFSGGKEAIWIQLSDIINEFEAGFLNEYLSSSITPEEKQEEEFLNHIINGNSHEKVSKLLDFIQKQFSKECLWASLGGENGGKIVRAAFAVIIKHAGLLTQFQETVEDIDNIISQGKVDSTLKNFIKKWHAASRMRTWLVEKRKEIDDMAERNRQTAIASKSRANVQADSKPAKKDEPAASKKKALLKAKKKKKESELTFQDTLPQEKPVEEEAQPQAQLQVRDTEEIIQRMIEQIVKKAQFLIQLIPAKHWSQDQIEKKEKQLLFRASSEVDEYTNKEEEWKRRLLQWKSVRQSKNVYKSLEDESREIHASLTTSVLQCLQSPVSIRRLRKQVESSYLRAICRTIGLNALTQILLGCKGSLFRQDIVGWLCSALRGNENKLYHFTDNLQGCGHFLESSINTAFKNLIQAAVKSMINSDWADEIKCMLEALKWKYHGDDHAFLAEIDLFGILRGIDAKSLLRRAWGRSLHSNFEGFFLQVKTSYTNKMDSPLVKKLLELFEIIVILCVGKLQSKHNASLAEALSSGSGGPAPLKKDKLPQLERHVSAIDEYSAEILIRQAFSVIFTELREADMNYRSFSGLDWCAWQRTLLRKEKKEEEEKRKKKGGKKPAVDENNDEDLMGEEEQGEGSDSDEDEREERPGDGASSKDGEEDDDEVMGVEEEMYEEVIEENEKEEEKYEGEMEEEIKEMDLSIEDEGLRGGSQRDVRGTKRKDTKTEKKDEKDEGNEEAKKKKRNEKIKDAILKEEKNLLDLINQIYNPEFLYHLLKLLYKCSSLGLDQVAIVIGNPKYIAILFSLLRSAPPNHKILITKILSIVFQTLPFELLADSIGDFMRYTKDSVEAIYLNPNEKNLQGNSQILDYLMKVVYDIRKRTFTENIDYEEDYAVSCELVDFFRSLLQQPAWNKALNEYLRGYLVNSKDIVQQILAVSILGGEVNGLRYSGKIMICSTDVDELFNDNVLLKSKLEDSKETAIILGFSENYKEKISDDEKKKFKPEDDPRFNIRMNMGPIMDGRNPAVLIYSSLAKDITNLSTIELTTVNRFNVFAIDSTPFEACKAPLDSGLIDLYQWALDKNRVSSVIESKSIYLKALTIKSFNTYLSQNPENTEVLMQKKKDLFKDLLFYANQQVITSDNLMNLELTEERLYRLLASSSQTELNLSDLKNVTITIKNYELEAQFAKDFSNKKYPIQSGYNLEKVSQYYELIPYNEAKVLDKKALATKAVLISPSEWSEEFVEWSANNCKLVVTHGLDLQKLQEQCEGNALKPASKRVLPLKKKKSNVKEEKDGKLRRSRSQVGKKAEKPALPGCIANISERYFNELHNEYIAQSKKEFKNIFREKRLVDELVEFGFPKEIIDEYFLENSKASIEAMINDISKLVELKEDEKAKAISLNQNEAKEENIEENAAEKEGKPGVLANEEAVAEEEIVEETAPELFVEDIEKEEPNACFKCKGDKEQSAITEEKNRLYDNSIDFESMNRIGKIILFKQTNYNFSIYHARRAVLTLLNNWNANIEAFILENTDQLLRFMKLICFEAIYSSAIFCNNALINKIKDLLTKFFDLQKENAKIREFLSLLFEKCVVESIFDLQKRHLQGASEKSREKTLAFTGRINNECEIEAPFLDFSLWLSHLYFNSVHEEIHEKMLRLDLLYVILGLLTVLKQNKSLGWGMITFCLDYLEFLKANLKKLVAKDPSIFQLFDQENVLKLHNYLYGLRSREKIEAHSRKTQMISEILINLNLIYRSLDKLHNEEDAQRVLKICDTRLDLDKFKVIENISDVVEMMQNYQENKILLASTWLQTSTDLIKKEQKTIDGDHFYYKNLHSFKISMPFTTESTIKFSEDSQTDLGDSILFSSDPKGENSLQKLGGNLSKKTVVFPAGMFYVHFPAKGSDIFTFGSNESAQLGSGDTNGNGPFCLEQFSSANVLNIDANDSHMMILTKTGELWSCGSGSQTGIQSGSTRVLSKVQSKEKVRLMSCGSNFSIFGTENNELYGVGSNTDGRFGLNWNNGTANPQKIDFSFSKVVKQISCGYNHTLLLTNEGQVYCTGSNEYGQLGLVDENGNKSANVNTFRVITDISKKKVTFACAGMYASFIIVKDKEKGGATLMSCGEKANGKLGLGQDVQNNVINFTAISELKNCDVKSVFCKKKHVLALTSSGKLYSWGLNEHGQLGLGHTENEFKPKLVPFFENMKVIACGAGNHHSVVVAKGKNEEYAKVYTFGENTSNRLCLKQGKERIVTPQHVEFFDEKAPFQVIVGSNHSIIMTENMKIPKFRDLHKISCATCATNPVANARFITQSQGKYQDLCGDCFEKAEKKPAICLFIKESMLQTKEFQWPALESIAESSLETQWPDENNREFAGTCCRNCKQSPIKDVIFCSVHEKDYSFSVCSKCYCEIIENQVSSTIYYRLERPLKAKASLPIFSRNYFFTNSDTYGYNITITPKFSEKGHDYMIEKYQESYKAFSEEFSNLKPETDEQIVDLINNIAQKKEKNAFELEDNVNFPKEEVNIRAALDKCSVEFLRKRFLILKNFNTRIKAILPYIDFSAKKDQNRLRNVYSNASIYIFWDVKSELFEKVRFLLTILLFFLLDPRSRRETRREHKNQGE